MAKEAQILYRALLNNHMAIVYLLKHESEIRLIYEARNASEIRDDNFFDIDIEPNDLIEEIVLDPRLLDDEFIAIKNKYEKPGYTGPIRHSKLYTLNF